MPYSSTDGLPSPVKNAIPSDAGRRLFMNVVNSSLESGKSESVAFASAWAALRGAGYSKDDDGKWHKRGVSKYAINAHQFTTPSEAMGVGQILGLGATYHVWETSDGQKVYMPGETHAQYMGYEHEEDEVPNSPLTEAIGAIISSVIGKKKETTMPETTKALVGKVLKLDTERRIVYGWASVSTEKGELVVDSQGDIILPEEMEKMADEFMLSVRAAKAMHEGGAIGEVIHSLPLTKSLAEALDITADREGWIIAMKIHDDEIWGRVKAGELGAFSIGGVGRRIEV